MLVHQTFTDIDQHAAQMCGFEQQYVQLSRGAFNGVFSSFSLPRGIGFDVEWVGPALHQQACVPPATVSIVSFLDLDGRAIFNGREVHGLDSFALPPGTSLDVRTPPNARVSVVSIPASLLEAELAACAGPGQAGVGLKAALQLDRVTCSATLAPALRESLAALEARPELLADERIASSMAGGLLQSVLQLLTDRERSGEHELTDAKRRWDVFMMAKEAIHRAGADEWSVGGLCEVTGVSRRTLEYCFDEAVAMSPLQYLKIKRLNSVRRELTAACDDGITVGDVAARHGIWHLGRLSKDYRQLFGELPSATLRRARPAAGAVRPASTPRNSSTARTAR